MRRGVQDCRGNRIGQVRQPIVHPEALFAANHQPGASEVREMPGHGRLGEIQAFVDVADADFPAAEQAEDPQPRTVRQRLEERFHYDKPSIHIRLDKYSMLDRYSH